VPNILVFANQSGGSVKTTSAVSIATKAAQAERRVLVIDLDPQRDASHIFGYTDPDSLCGACGEVIQTDERNRPIADCSQGTGRHQPRVTMFDVICGEGFDLEEAIVPALAGCAEPIPGIDIALSSHQLSAADMNLATKIGADQRLEACIVPIADKYDVILIDCPPSLGKLMVAILYASTHVIACVKPGMKEIRALTELERTIRTVNQALHRGEEKLALGAVLVGDVPAETHGKAYLQATELVREEYGDLAMPTIARSVRVPEAYAYQTPITLYDPRGQVSKDYAKVFEVLEKRGLI
jgi:chromosome partitioning protein